MVTATDTDRSLMTAREVAEALSVSTETILRWTRRGVLPGFRLPSGALRYRATEFGVWLTERATPRGEVSSNPYRGGAPCQRSNVARRTGSVQTAGACGSTTRQVSAAASPHSRPRAQRSRITAT